MKSTSILHGPWNKPQIVMDHVIITIGLHPTQTSRFASTQISSQVCENYSVPLKRRSYTDKYAGHSYILIPRKNGMESSTEVHG
jgi:hypothetical protein